MMSNPNVVIARRWFEELWNERRPGLADEFLAPESFCRSEAGTLYGAETFVEQIYEPFIEAFPDLDCSIWSQN